MENIYNVIGKDVNDWRLREVSFRAKVRQGEELFISPHFMASEEY